jgi:hypothetical protein
MTIEKEIADMLNGLKYGEEIKDDVLRYAKANRAGTQRQIGLSLYTVQATT